MIDRVQIVANSAASLRLEGLRSDADVDELLEAWARGEAAEEDLREAEGFILRGGSRHGPPAPVASAGAPHAA